MSLTFYTSCIRIERTDGFVLCITELDKDITINDIELGLTDTDQNYLSVAGYTRTNMQSTSDNSVNNADIEGVLTFIGVNREDIIAGRYDFAKLYIFIWDYKNNVMVKKLSSGHWGESTIKDGSYTAEFRSLSQQLQQTIGRTYNPGCDAQLGDDRCTIDLTGYTETGEVLGVTDTRVFTSTITGTNEDDVFNYGKITFTSGLNSGLHVEVKKYTLIDNVVELFLPMPFDIQVGDTFELYKGCDKRLETCKVKFSNNINFRGFPYIPGIDQVSKFGGQ